MTDDGRGDRPRRRNRGDGPAGRSGRPARRPRAELDRLWARGRAFLGTELAIMGGAMTWVSERHLVAAISNAGGFGVIASGSMSPELLDAEIAATAALTRKPFGVNLITLHPQLAELIDVCVARRVGHVVLAGGTAAGAAAIQRIRDGGARVICFAPALVARAQARAHGRRRDRHRGQRGRRPYRAGRRPPCWRRRCFRI